MLTASYVIMPRMTSNRDLLSRSLSAVWHPCTQMKRHETLPLMPIARGEGVWLYDPDGKRYLDTVSSWWVNLFGHCNPRINAALTDQLGKLEHVIWPASPTNRWCSFRRDCANSRPPGWDIVSTVNVKLA